MTVNGPFFISPNVKESKIVLDSGFADGDSGFQVLDSGFFSVEVRFGIPIVSWIPDSLICIPDSKAQDFRFHKQKFPGFRNPLHGAILSMHVLFFNLRPRDVTPKN